VSEAPFFLIIIDEDRKQFAVEGPLPSLGILPADIAYETLFDARG
jgi:hypothetical protein